MRKCSILLIVFSVFISCRSVKGNPPLTQKSSLQIVVDFYVNVVGISDGDTFKGLTPDNREIRFRIQGIDAPENKQAFSSRSKEKLSDLIFGKRVGIKIHTKRDRYGRPVVYVYTPNGMDVGAEMIKSGMAWHFKRYDNSDYYAQLESQARNSRIGLWLDKSPIPPWNYRRK